MIQLLYWLMPVKTPNGWTLALTQESMGGIQPIIGLINFSDRKELPGVAQMLYSYVMKLHSDWDSVVGDKPTQTDIPDVFKKAWEEENNELGTKEDS